MHRSPADRRCAPVAKGSARETVEAGGSVLVPHQWMDDGGGRSGTARDAAFTRGYAISNDREPLGALSASALMVLGLDRPARRDQRDSNGRTPGSRHAGTPRSARAFQGTRPRADPGSREPAPVAKPGRAASNGSAFRLPLLSIPTPPAIPPTSHARMRLRITSVCRAAFTMLQMPTAAEIAFKTRFRLTG